MTLTVQKCLKGVLACAGRFRSDTRGQIVIIFAFASLAIVSAVGAGVDLSRAFTARQRLSEVATLTCQFASRESVRQTANSTYSGPNGFQSYKDNVNAFASSSLNALHWSAGNPATALDGSTNYFTATPAVGTPSNAAVATGPTGLSVVMKANVQTSFMQIMRVSQIPVQASINCATAVTSTSTPATTPNVNNKPPIFSEGFETPCTAYCFTLPNGSTGTSANPTTSFTTAASYTGSSGAKWYIVGYCLETDSVGIISGTVPEGTHSAELDCDNGSGSAGNSSISSKTYMAVGNYELRYNYRGRVDQPDFDPTYICGSTASDSDWLTKRFPSNNLAVRTNQINVYLDMAANNVTPLHTTLDGAQQLAGTNMIDSCVYSQNWVERSVRITITTPAFYWLSFAADGANDSYGGQIDNIRLCQEVCAGTLQDNFPTTWMAANNGGVNKLLFEDTFDTPVYTQDYPYHYIAKGGNLSLSTGTTGTLASGWPSAGTSGWATGPFNQITYALNGAYQGTQYVALDGYNSNGSYPKNRSINRAFYLDPGYYQVSYNYVSMVDFSGVGIFGTFCTAAPASGQIYGGLTDATGQIRYYNSTVANGDTNIVGVFMSHGSNISTPGSAVSQGAATPFTNPNGTTSTYPALPTVAPDAVNYQSYNAAQVNPLIDVCGYADTYRWIPRSVAVKITKPGLYWLTFSANDGVGDPTHTGDGNGGGIDDVKLTALGSPFMASPPTSALTTIPVPAPQPDSSYNNSGAFNGFSIVADPFMPPAADQ